MLGLTRPGRTCYSIHENNRSNRTAPSQSKYSFSLAGKYAVSNIIVYDKSVAVPYHILTQRRRYLFVICSMCQSRLIHSYTTCRYIHRHSHVLYYCISIGDVQYVSIFISVSHLNGPVVTQRIENVACSI